MLLECPRRRRLPPRLLFQSQHYFLCVPSRQKSRVELDRSTVNADSEGEKV